MKAVLEEVRLRIQQRSLSWSDAAKEIGVGEPSLRRHLEGGYVRSDSLAKYSSWLSGDKERRSRPVELFPTEAVSRSAAPIPEPSLPPLRESTGVRPHRVVDLFSGCGGLSLGFDLLNRGSVFRTVLAIDVEEAMVRAYNTNHPTEARLPIARKIDLSDFVSEAEVLALYLDHLAEIERDESLRKLLNSLPGIGLDNFHASMRKLDGDFVTWLIDTRQSSEFLKAYRNLDSQVLNQTSVIGFHACVKLPPTSTSRSADLGPIIWGCDGRDPGGSAVEEDHATTVLREVIVRELEALWDREVEGLRERAGGRGRGQLASSGPRIGAFVRFLDTEVAHRMRDAWLTWRSRRDALRFRVFSDPAVRSALSQAYNNGRGVSVVLGGPPCQGFSRIGRGKIRSLRNDRVHVHYDEDAGDARNRLLHKYVLFVRALAPDAFLFENVRHFQSEVKTPAGTYLATEVLADAIRDISGEGPVYKVAHRILTAADHLVPQARERFFMLGLREEAAGDTPPAWCLNLPCREEIPLRVALDDLPEPHFVNDREGDVPPLARTFHRDVHAAPGDTAAAVYRRWIRQPAPQELHDRREGEFDGHCARPARPDDASWFEMMGPGKRWMDYRSDRSGTLNELRTALELLTAASLAARSAVSPVPPELETLRALDPTQLQSLVAKVDGSLPLRLLLENIEPMPGEPRHHLATANYLAKREGNHGDWLARLHPDEPCKTIVTHMGKDTYAYIHPTQARTISVREAARVQTFPDWFRLGQLSLVDAFRVIGNAVPPLLATQLAERIARVLEGHRLRMEKAGDRPNLGPFAASA